MRLLRVLLLPVIAACIGLLFGAPVEALLGVAPSARATCVPPRMVWGVTSAFPRNGELVVQDDAKAELVDASGVVVPVKKDSLGGTAVQRLRPLALLRAHATYEVRDANGPIAVVETSDVVDEVAPVIAHPAQEVGRYVHRGCPSGCGIWVAADATDDDTPFEGLRYVVRAPTGLFQVSPARPPSVDETEPHAPGLPAQALLLGTSSCGDSSFVCWNSPEYAALSAASLVVVAVDRAGNESTPVPLRFLRPEAKPAPPPPHAPEQVAVVVEARSSSAMRLASMAVLVGLTALAVVALRLARAR